MKKIFYCLSSALVLLTNACKEQDSIFEKYVVPSGIVYTGRPVSPIVYSGENRVLLTWHKGTDQNITKTVIYWNNYDDSLIVDMTGKQDSVGVYINNLEEKYYSFYLRTFDDYGHSSVWSEVTGPVYGSRYISNLLTRPVASAVLDISGRLDVEWGEADVSNGAFAVELSLDANDKLETLRLGVEESKTILNNIDNNVICSYQTLFLPSATAIDTFRSAITTMKIKKDVTATYLKNYQRPFLYSSWDGTRYGILSDWTTTDAVKNKGGYGGFDNLNNGASFGFEQWTTDPAIPNGKIYRTVTLPAGYYELSFYFGTDNPGVGNTGTDARYLAVAAGSTLPDVADINRSLAYVSLVGVGTNDFRTISFTLAEPTEVSIGMVVNFTSTRQNIRGNRFQITAIN
ncbi:MAG: DUF5013 domain-containing protein [Tannerella sp.]|jgi:hypothetical protein|nr:DUF5013 domain-containing protein [Tannerella sp.]